MKFAWTYQYSYTANPTLIAQRHVVLWGVDPPGNTLIPVSPDTDCILSVPDSVDSDGLAKLVTEFGPDLIICGGTASKDLLCRLRQSGSNNPGGLGYRETQVLSLLARGFTNRAIADEIGLKVRTVKGYLTGLFERFQVTNRVELLNAAKDFGPWNERAPAGPKDERNRCESANRT